MININCINYQVKFHNTYLMLCNLIILLLLSFFGINGYKAYLDYYNIENSYIKFIKSEKAIVYLIDFITIYFILILHYAFKLYKYNNKILESVEQPLYNELKEDGVIENINKCDEIEKDIIEEELDKSKEYIEEENDDEYDEEVYNEDDIEEEEDEEDNDCEEEDEDTDEEE